MRRLMRFLAISVSLALSLVTAVTAATAAHAATVKVGACASVSAYPPTSGPTLMVSTTTPYQGQRIEVGGADYCPDEDVTLTLGGTTVATVHTSAHGSFDTTITITADPGTYQLTGTGADGDSASVTLTVRSASGVAPVSTQANPSGAAAGSSSGGGGLAFTGLDVIALVAIALLLVGAGIYLTRAGRRRHAHG